MAVTAEAIEQLHFFNGLPPWALRTLAASATETEHALGDIILRQHDEVTSMSFLLSGRVAFLLRFQGAADLVVGLSDQVGGLVGWSMFRAPYRSTATVRCEQNCVLLNVPRAGFDEVFARDPAVHLLILRRVAEAAAVRLMQARDSLVQTAEPAVRSEVDR